MREFVRIFDDCFNSLVIADFKCLCNHGGYLAYDIPDSLTNGQFHSILTNIFEKSANGLVVGETSGCGKYVVLQEHYGRVGNLCGEVSGLAFPKSEILLTILENNFDRPTHGVNLIGFVEPKVCIGGKHSTPWGALAAAHVKQTYGHIINESINNNIIAAVSTTVLHALDLGGKFGDDCLGRNLFAILLKGKPHAFLSHLYHAEIVAFDASGLDEAENIFASEPTVSEQIIETVSVLYSPSDHLFEKLDLTHGVVAHTLCRRTFLVSNFLKTVFQFGIRHGMIALFARLADYIKINDVLAFAVTDGEYQRLEPQYHLVGYMAEDTSNFLGVEASLRVIRIIGNETNRIVGMVGANRNPAPELAGDVIGYFTPVKTVVIEKPIEDILRGAA